MAILSRHFFSGGVYAICKCKCLLWLFPGETVSGCFASETEIGFDWNL
jgi:hypothetical protein